MKHTNPIIRPTVTTILLAVCTLLSPVGAQTVKDHIRENPAYASCNYHIYPDSIDAKLTPAPKGKQPFYISHYGRHGSRYISNRSGFDEPFMMMMHADSLDELTPTGQRVLEVMKQIMNNSEDRWGELTEHGRRQHREIIRRMAERFPEVLGDTAHVEARSTIVPRCMISMGTAMMELAQINPRLRITMESSKRTMGYMNYQDRDLRKIQMSAQAKEAYNKFIANNTRLMELIFKNPDIVNEIVDENYFNYYLMKMGLFQVHTPLSKNTYITDIFHIDELYRLWEVDNAIWYIRHGACKLNGGTQPYSQRYLLRQIIADADSSSCVTATRRSCCRSSASSASTATTWKPTIWKNWKPKAGGAQMYSRWDPTCSSSSTAAAQATTTSFSRYYSMKRKPPYPSAPTAPPITIGATSASIT